MKSAIICLAILGACIYESVSLPESEGAQRGLETPQDVQRKPFGQPLIIQRLLQFPIGALKIALGEPEVEYRKPDVLPKVFVPPSDGTMTEEAPVTEEDWQPLEFNGTEPVVKALIDAPNRCKEGQGFVGGKCREIV